MDPLWVIVSITCFQVMTTGFIYMYEKATAYQLLGSKDDTYRYYAGEISWWEIRDTDAVTWKRIEECNRAVATKNLPFINSILCLIQSWKLKMKIDAINLIKDTAAFIAAHIEFCLILMCLSAAACLLRLSFLRWKKGEQGFDDACSYKSPHVFRPKHYDETICSEKIRENMGDILEDWGKLRNVSNAKRPSIKDNGKPSTKNDSLDN